MSQLPFSLLICASEQLSFPAFDIHGGNSVKNKKRRKDFVLRGKNGRKNLSSLFQEEKTSSKDAIMIHFLLSKKYYSHSVE